MKLSPFSLSFCIVLFFCCFVRCQKTKWCDDSENELALRNSLSAFYGGTQIKYWIRTYGWDNQTLCPCDWVGVNCVDPLVKLSLTNNNITGGLLEGFCANIYSSIDFSGNSLFGKLPSCLSEMTELVSLSLASNSFQGLLPESLGSLSHIRLFNIENNEFAGSFPNFLQHPSKYWNNASLHISGNKFWCPSPGWCKSDQCASCDPEPSSRCTDQNEYACSQLLRCCYKDSWDEEVCNQEIDNANIECQFNSDSDISPWWWLALGILAVLLIVFCGGAIAVYLATLKKPWVYSQQPQDYVDEEEEDFSAVDPDIYGDELPPRSSFDYEL